MRISTPLHATLVTALILCAGQASASPLMALPRTALARFAATAEPLMIPEPASAALLVVGLTISAVAARKRRRPRKPPESPLP
jgi:hypothetical protein